MRPLYEIEAELLQLVNEETGEIEDFDKLEELTLERKTKLENVALYLLNLNAELEAVGVQKKKFVEREQRIKNQIEGLKGYLKKSLNGEKFSTTRVNVSFRRSEAVEITDEKVIEGQYWKNKPELDKAAIKAALKNGETVRGASLVQRSNISVK